MNNEKAKKVRRRLKQLAGKESQYHINELRIIVALERAVARIEQHKDLKNNIIFKGGFVLLKITGSKRFTRDVDALAINIDKEKFKNMIREALTQDVDDGLWFGDVNVENLEAQGEYGSYRFDCAYQIGEPDMKKVHKLSRVHVDVGFSDKLETLPSVDVMPVLIQDEAPVFWRVYPIEYIFAEKLQTLFDRGSTNSRANDIYDIVYLKSQPMDEQMLIQAIQETFTNRDTDIPNSFSDEIKDLDTTFLEAAWPGIRVIGNKTDFEDAWQQLIAILKDIDDLGWGFSVYNVII